MDNFYKELVEFFEENSDIVWGVSNIDFSEYKKFYRCSLVMAIYHKELIGISNYKLCNQKRSLYLKTHNRKNSCGLCMVACPIGIK